MKLISGEMIGNSNHTGISLNGRVQEVQPKGINTFQFPQKSFIQIKMIERLIGLPLKNKTIRYHGFLKRKQIIEEIEAELNESSEINSKTDNLAVTNEADVDEAIPNIFEKNKNTSISENNEH